MTWQNEGLGYNTHKYSRDAPIQSIGLVLVVILTLLSGLRFGQTSGSTLNIVLNIGFFFFSLIVLRYQLHSLSYSRPL